MIRFTVHVHPGSRTRSIGGSYQGALRVHVSARAVDGAATSEVLRILAEGFDVRESAVHLVRGSRSRTKSISIDGDEARLQRQLDTLLSQGTGA